MQTLMYVKSQEFVQVLANCCSTICIITNIFAANGFHQNNAENVHSVAKRDARKVQHMVFYCNVLYTLFCIDNCLVASFLPSVLTASQSSQTYQSSGSTQGFKNNWKPQDSFTFDRNICVQQMGCTCCWDRSVLLL